MNKRMIFLFTEVEVMKTLESFFDRSVFDLISH